MRTAVPLKEDPIFCLCGKPATTFVSSRGEAFAKCAFEKKCKFFTGVMTSTVAAQQARKNEWLSIVPESRTGPPPPGVDFRCFVENDKVWVGLRLLGAPFTLIRALKESFPDVQDRSFKFSNFLQLSSSTPSDTNASGSGSAAAPPQSGQEPTSFSIERVLVLPFERYNDAVELVRAHIPTHRVFLLPPWICDAVKARERIDAEEVPFIGGRFVKLYPYQREGVGAGIKRGGRVLIADEMGLGKTSQALGIAYNYREHGVTVIVCPASLVGNWQREVLAWWAIDRERVLALRSGSKKRIGTHVAVAIVSYLCVAAVSDVTPSTVIVDESHMIKTDTTSRTKAVTALCDRCERVILLTGTPTLAKPVELYSQLRALVGPSPGRPAPLPGRTEFQRRYCNLHHQRFGQRAGAPNADGFNRLEELNVLLRTFMVRRLKAHVLSELPPKERHLITLTLKDEELQKCAAAGQPAGRITEANMNSRVNLELYNKVAAVKKSAVEDYVDSLVTALVQDGGTFGDAPPSKVLLFAHHRDMLHAIRGALTNRKVPLDCIFIDGETKQQDRDQLVSHFQTTPSCQFAVLSILAAGTGLNFTAANLVVFCELHWTPSLLLQCEDRVHRMGQRSTCTIRYLLAEGTCEEQLWGVLRGKLEVNTAVVADDALTAGENAAVLVERSDAKAHQRSGAKPQPQPPIRPGTLDEWCAKSTMTTLDHLHKDALEAPVKPTGPSDAELARSKFGPSPPRRGPADQQLRQQQRPPKPNPPMRQRKMSDFAVPANAAPRVAQDVGDDGCACVEEIDANYDQDTVSSIMGQFYTPSDGVHSPRSVGGLGGDSSSAFKGNGTESQPQERLEDTPRQCPEHQSMPPAQHRAAPQQVTAPDQQQLHPSPAQLQTTVLRTVEVAPAGTAPSFCDRPAVVPPVTRFQPGARAADSSATTRGTGTVEASSAAAPDPSTLAGASHTKLRQTSESRSRSEPPSMPKRTLFVPRTVEPTSKAAGSPTVAVPPAAQQPPLPHAEAPSGDLAPVSSASEPPRRPQVTRFAPKPSAHNPPTTSTGVTTVALPNLSPPVTSPSPGDPGGNHQHGTTTSEPTRRPQITRFVPKGGPGTPPPMQPTPEVLHTAPGALANPVSVDRPKRDRDPAVPLDPHHDANATEQPAPPQPQRMPARTMFTAKARSVGA